MPRDRYSKYKTKHYYNRATGWNARRWSSDWRERRAALLRDLRAERRLADERRKKRREAAIRRRYHRSGIRIVRPREYSGYTYPIMRTYSGYLILLAFLPILVTGIIVFTLLGSSSTPEMMIPVGGLLAGGFILLILIIGFTYKSRTRRIREAVQREESEKEELLKDKDLKAELEKVNKEVEKFCPYCGNPIEEHFKRCKYCDAKLID